MDGLEEQYGSEITFYRFDAAVSENERLQSELGLRGHPSVAIIDSDKAIVQRYFGPQTADTLNADLEAIRGDK